MECYVGASKGFEKVFVQKGEDGEPFHLGPYADSNEVIIARLRELDVTSIKNASEPYQIPLERFNEWSKLL